MIDNIILSKLKCMNCGKFSLTYKNNLLVCNKCNHEYKYDNSPLLIKPSRIKELQLLIDLNLQDRPTGLEGEGSRLHGKDVYFKSGYSERLFNELMPVDNDLILDLGCGRGQISEYFKMRGFKVLSVDIVKENLAEVENNNKILASIDDLPLADNSFECIVCTDVFEHIYPDMQNNVIAEIFRVLKPGGKLLISYPGNNLPNLTGVHLMNLGIFILRIFDKRLSYMSWREPPAHINMSYPWLIKREFRKNGFIGNLRPYSNKYLTLPKKYKFITDILNSKFISMFFIHLMHGVLTKPISKKN